MYVKYTIWYWKSILLLKNVRIKIKLYNLYQLLFLKWLKVRLENWYITSRSDIGVYNNPNPTLFSDTMDYLKQRFLTGNHKAYFVRLVRHGFKSIVRPFRNNFLVFLTTVWCNQIGTVRKRKLSMSLQFMNNTFRQVLNK